MLKIQRHQPQNQRHQKKRRSIPEITPSNSIPPPPDIQQHHHGEHHRRAFGQHRSQEKHQRSPVKNPSARVLEPHEETPRQQKKRERKGVFQLRDPSNRLHCNWMNRKNQPHQPSPPQPDSSQQSPNQARPQSMKQHRRHMVAGRVHPEPFPHEPKQAHREREVVGRFRLHPKTREPIWRLHHRVRRDQIVVIPQPVAIKDRRVNPQAGDHDHDHLHDQGFPFRKIRLEFAVGVHEKVWLKKTASFGGLAPTQKLSEKN